MRTLTEIKENPIKNFFRTKTLYFGITMVMIFSMLFYIYYKQKVPLFGLFELKSSDLRYAVRNIGHDMEKEKERFQVIIASIDEKSLSSIGKWPWKRSVHADFIRKLKEYGVKSIGFDVSFTEKAQPSENITEYNKLLNETIDSGYNESKIDPDFYGVLKGMIDGFDVSAYKKGLKEAILTGYRDKKIEKDKALELAKLVKKFDTNEDVEFALALKETENVIIGTYTIADKKDAYIINDDEGAFLRNVLNLDTNPGKELIERGRTGEGIFRPYSIYKVQLPIGIISKNCFGVGSYEVGTPDADGEIRSIPAVNFEQYSGMHIPPMFFLAYVKAMGYTIEQNVALDAVRMKIKIYKKAATKSGLIKEIPINFKGEQQLNYYGQNAFKEYSYIDLLNGKIDGKLLKDKIVLVGYTSTARGLVDVRATPFDPNTSGVHIHATAIQNIIDNKYMERAPVIPQTAMLVMFGLFMTVALSMKAVSFTNGNLIIVFVITAYLSIAQLLFNNGIWIELFYPLVVFILIYLILAVMNYFLEEREKKKVKQAFQHYMSPTLMEEVLKHPEKLKLGGERKVLTAFFSDIEGFTTISEGMDPERLVEFLNEYLSVMTDIIFDYDGMVDKYEGDAIMAVFGSPIFREDHPLKACLAAIRYQKALDELRPKWVSRGLAPIYARIGINTGVMVSGNMGSQKRFDYTVIGDEVNLASRLEGANKMYGTYIMISQETYNQVKDFVAARELDKIKVKGKNKPVEVYELIDEKAALTESKAKLIEAYNQGIKLYKERKWQESIIEFKKALEIEPDDGPSKLYIERSGYFIENPPGEEWDGVYTFTTK